MVINVWTIITNAMAAEITALFSPGVDGNGDPILPVAASTYTALNTMPPEIEAFFNSHDDIEAVLQAGVEDAGKRLYSFYVRPGEDTDMVLTELAALSPDLVIAGVWHYEDGREYGTDWDYSDPENPVLTGSPTYPQDVTLINYMPDIIVGGTPEVPVYGPPTEVVDLNLYFGQAPRTLD